MRYTKELLEQYINNSTTWAQVCRHLGVKPATGAQTYIKKRAKEFGIDSSHFVGQRWNRGRQFPPRRPIEFYLVKDSNVKSDWLRQRLIKEGFKEHKCEMCQLTEWNKKPIPLELDHINSDHADNRLVNLQVLCPNCHSQRHHCAGMAELVDAPDLESGTH